MIEKYIVAEAENIKKGYLFQKTFLSFDKDVSSLIIPDEYVSKDIDSNICYLNSLLDEIVNAGVYSSLSSLKRSIKRGSIRAELNIIYICDINKSKLSPSEYRDKVNSLDDLDIYCSGIQYIYSMKDNNILRYELYGDPLLGDDVCRRLSELK